MSRYLLTPRAEQDFHEIRRWYERQRGTAAARKVILDLRSQLRNLALHPDIGHAQEDLASSRDARGHRRREEEPDVRTVAGP